MQRMGYDDRDATLMGIDPGAQCPAVADGCMTGSY
jgi:hypothetical protein